ncbi:30S ribosomal protein S6 [Alphaproteobacteria bacterium endosymbiont of Tiliacea citrago]|uniref:30S ribosomal protein S6 n=1 Tax=Alphaproteobacteria bacterium endosymbiont of Tiliacea citrago TaxID=3077944 RepID=UPI00313C64C2
MLARKRLVELYGDGKRNYEVCLILHQHLSEDEVKKKLSSLKAIIETEIVQKKDEYQTSKKRSKLAVNPSDENTSTVQVAEVVEASFTKIRSFSYPINDKSNSKGYYVCLYTKSSPSIVDIIKKKISLESDVLRVLISLANPKKQSYGIFSNQYETDAYKNKNKFYSYDDPNTLSKFLGEQARIAERKGALFNKKPPKNQSKIQRSVSKVIKTARFLSILPYREE